MATNGTTGHSIGLPKTQKAAQYSSKSNTVSVNTVPLPTPSTDQLLIKVSSASLCHSDLMLFEPTEAGIVLGDGDQLQSATKPQGQSYLSQNLVQIPHWRLAQRLAFYILRTSATNVWDAKSTIAGVKVVKQWCLDLDGLDSFRNM